MDVRAVHGKVDFAIITVREDEDRAVLQHFPVHDQVVGGRRRHSLCRVQVTPTQSYLVTVTRCVEQGPGEGQQTAQMTIDDLDPRWLMVVGIAGAVPSDDFTLGDVVAPIRMQYFCVMADIEGAPDQYAMAGGPMHVEVQDFLANLPACDASLQGWNDVRHIGMTRPDISLHSTSFYGDTDWQRAARATLTRHFTGDNARRAPRYVVGCIASSNRLVKSVSTIRAWLQYARHVQAVEMELAGIYRAARQRHREYPILAIRGISDIIGFKRDDQWTAYACRSAAAFARAVIGLQPIPLRPIGGDGQPGHAQYDCPEIIDLLFRYLEDACDDGKLAQICLTFHINTGNIVIPGQSHTRHAANLVGHFHRRHGTVKALVEYALQDLQEREHPLYAMFRETLSANA